MATRSRTDGIRGAICDELDRRQEEIDGDIDLARVTVIVVLNRRTGRPEQVMWRPESQRDVRE
jgi:hypothetical protein